MNDKIVCFHLFNDYSGSPKVLYLVLNNLLQKGLQIDLITSKGGVLDELVNYQNLKYSTYKYVFTSNSIVTFLRFLEVQLYTFFLSFRYLFEKDTVFYINTLLPVGPALAGRLMGKKVVYHYHENARVKGLFYRTLCKCMEILASDIICVSKYQRSFLSRQKSITVIPNALSRNFVKRIRPDAERAFSCKRILMLASLKLYKGTLEFIRLAVNLPQFQFELVINDTSEHIDDFRREQAISFPENLTVYSRQNDVVPFYNRASLVLNLSNKEKIVETFGLTALEAMAAGLPVIVPTVGGIAEMVEDGVNGYKIDVQDIAQIEKIIALILEDKSLYVALSKHALSFSRNFSEEAMCKSIMNVLSH